MKGSQGIFVVTVHLSMEKGVSDEIDWFYMFTTVQVTAQCTVQLSMEKGYQMS